jgi:putative nucleotidyltransferase with HDIG domain
VPAGWGGVVAPIRTRDEVIGVLQVSAPLPREFNDDEMHLLSTLAEIGANAVHRSRLHEQTTEQLERLSALHRIDMTISSSVDLHFTLQVLVDEVMGHLMVDACDVLLLEPGDYTLVYASGRGFRTRAIESTHVMLGQDEAGRAALERRIITSTHLDAPGSSFTRKEQLAGEAFHRHWAAPLIAKNEVKGVIELFQRKPRELSAGQFDFLEALATQAAIAIDDATMFGDLQKSNMALHIAYDATIEGWSRALDLRDKETEGHSQRVTELTLELAEAMGVASEELVHLRRGALLHDIGKMGVPDSILLKPGPLSSDEWVIMRQHPVYAYQMLLPIEYLKPALDIPYCHHERWDGAGYPRGLKGKETPLAARIFAVIDVWDALRSERPYRPAWPEQSVRDLLRQNAGTQFDPEVVGQFLRLVESKS